MLVGGKPFMGWLSWVDINKKDTSDRCALGNLLQPNQHCLKLTPS